MEMVSETTQAYSSGSCPAQHHPLSESPLIQQVRIKLSVNTKQSDSREDLPKTNFLQRSFSYRGAVAWNQHVR